MPKFTGVVGYGQSVQTDPGVYEDQIVERKLSGDVLKNSRKMQDGTGPINGDLTPSNSISLVADAYARENFWRIRYISWAGTLWTVTDVTVERPRLILRLGKVYNGPRPADTGEEGTLAGASSSTDGDS
jgi:hypothetical protein